MQAVPGHSRKCRVGPFDYPIRVGDDDGVGACFQCGASQVKMRLCLPSLLLLLQVVEGEGDCGGDLLKQANLSVLEGVFFHGVDDERTNHLAVEMNRKGRGRAEAVSDRPFPPADCSRVVHEVVKDAGLALADASANGATAFRPVVGVDLDPVDVAMMIPGALRPG